MTIARLKAKNQITLPQSVIDRLKLRRNEFLQVDVTSNYVRLIPVMIEPRYTPDELTAIDRLVDSQRSKAKTLKAGKEFSDYIKRITK